MVLSFICPEEAESPGSKR